MIPIARNICILFHSDDVNYAFAKYSDDTDSEEDESMGVEGLRALADQQKLVLKMCQKAVEEEKSEGALYLEDAYTRQVDLLCFTCFTVFRNIT